MVFLLVYNLTATLHTAYVSTVMSRNEALYCPLPVPLYLSLYLSQLPRSTLSKYKVVQI